MTTTTTTTTTTKKQIESIIHHTLKFYESSSPSAFHSSLLDLFDIGRIKFLKEIFGKSPPSTRFVVRAIMYRFHPKLNLVPGWLDNIIIRTRAIKSGQTSITFQQDILLVDQFIQQTSEKLLFNDNPKLIISAKSTVVMVELQTEPNISIKVIKVPNNDILQNEYTYTKNKNNNSNSNDEQQDEEEIEIVTSTSMDDTDNKGIEFEPITISIRQSDCDAFQHLSNCRYATIYLDALENMSKGLSYQVQGLNIEYIEQIPPNTPLTIYGWLNEKKNCIFMKIEGENKKKGTKISMGKGIFFLLSSIPSSITSNDNNNGNKILHYKL